MHNPLECPITAAGRHCPTCDRLYRQSFGESSVVSAKRLIAQQNATAEANGTTLLTDHLDSLAFRSNVHHPTEVPMSLMKKYRARLAEGTRHAPTTAAMRDAMGTQLRGFGSVQTEPPPNGYASATPSRLLATDLTPDMDPAYEPFGTPPDPYAVAIAARQMNKE
jgi:hypothetical protein